MFFIRPYVWVVLALFTLPSLAMGAEPGGRFDFDQTVDEGVAYHKRGDFTKAQVKLDKAKAHPRAQSDFRFALFMARNAYRQLRIDSAFDWAKKAKRRADDEILSTRVDELLLEMSERYGPARFVGAEGETNSQGRIFFEAKTGLINKEKRQVFMAIREHYRSTDVELPTDVYLPYGQYTANSAPFGIKINEARPEVPIFLQVERATQDEGGSRTAWYVGMGSVVAIAAGIGAYFLLASNGGEQTGEPAHPIIIQNLRAR